ncbi:hypothetical protein [Brevibacterium aurantiacum]|uniref:hypothetical protein n=1 Tax=Brevibacterium aurantiacum TaxID=273384 RepID=UPI003084058A
MPAHKAGAASAISETAYEFGSVMGTAVLGGLSTMVFGSHLQSTLGAKASGPEFETLGSSLEHAGAQGGHLGDQLAEAAVASFDLGVQWAAGAAVVLVLIAAVLTSFGLKGAGRSRDLSRKVGPRWGGMRTSLHSECAGGPDRRDSPSVRATERVWRHIRHVASHHELTDSLSRDAASTVFFCRLRARTRPMPV